jgi:lipoprotein-anchoring transpeptidase ErfK/SrfK
MTALSDLFRLLFGLLSISGEVAPPADTGPASVYREAVVLVDRQTIIFLENGREANLSLVSTGRTGFDTPTGEFHVLYRSWAPISSTYHVRMPFWLCITPSGQIGLHQTFRSGTNHLGTKQSHGCVRMGFDTAQWSYDWLTVGSPVHIRAESPVPPATD